MQRKQIWEDQGKPERIERITISSAKCYDRLFSEEIYQNKEKSWLNLLVSTILLDTYNKSVFSPLTSSISGRQMCILATCNLIAINCYVEKDRAHTNSFPVCFYVEVNIGLY